ncbi:MAG: sugar transferase [Oscillospiraceae bacterium]|nr:sugar transferase [Oscillospiraceae bacterium]
MYRRHLQGWMKHFDFIVLDVFIMELSFFLAYFFRHNNFSNLWVSQLYRESALVILLAGFLISILNEIHKNILKRGYWQEFQHVLMLTIATTGVLLAYIFFLRHNAQFSRSVLGVFSVISTILVMIGNITWKQYLLKKKGNEFKRNHMLVLTHSSMAFAAITRILNNAFNSYEVVGTILIDNGKEVGEDIHGVPVVCKYRDAEQYMVGKWIDEVMIALPKDMPVPDEFLDMCMEMGITTHTKLSVETDRECQHTIEKYAGSTVLTESIRVASNRQLFVKRAMDILGAIVGLFFTAIFTVIIGPIIYFTDPGPIFFSQNRIGKNGRVFKIYKFRSMYKDAEKRKAELMEKNKMKGFMFKVDADPRILGSGPDGTKHGIGWFIRKTSIDEFPQFWNVMLGQMSLVGTRPPTVDEWKQYEAHHRARMAVRPGLTGLWQVSGRSDIQDFEEVIDLDMKYINNWDIGTDIKLILKTVGIIFTGKGAE